KAYIAAVFQSTSNSGVQPYTRFVYARRRKELDGRGTESLGSKSQRIIAPFFIADDSHFLDMLTLLHHEAHVAPVGLTLPSFEAFGNHQRADFPLPRDGLFGRYNTMLHQISEPRGGVLVIRVRGSCS